MRPHIPPLWNTKKIPLVRNEVLLVGAGFVCLIAFVCTFIFPHSITNVAFNSMFTPPPDGYLYSSSSEIDFIQYTNQNNQLTGNYTTVRGSNNSVSVTETYPYTVTGTIQDSSITFIVHGLLGYQVSMTGHIDGRDLLLQVPQNDGTIGIETFKGVTIDQYNQSVKRFQQVIIDQYQQLLNSQATATAVVVNNQATVTVENATQTAIAAAQQSVTNANQSLSSALGSLKSDDTPLNTFSEQSTLSGFEKDWQSMQNDLGTVQKDAAAGCGQNNGNYNVVSGDVNVVSGDKNTITGDDNVLSGDANVYNTDVSQVQSDAKAVSDAWNTLQSAISNNPTGFPQAQFAKSDIDTALSNATAVQNSAAGIWQDAQTKAKQYDQESDAELTQANNILSSMHCS